MNRRHLLKASLAAMLLPMTGQTAASSFGKTLQVGIFPRRNPKTTYRMFRPLSSYLSSKMGIAIRMSTAKNFADFWKNIENNRYDLVHFNQYHYIVANALHGYRAIAKNEENDLSTIAGSLIVRKDSNIQTLQDLKGKTIVFGGGPRAMQSYIIPRWLLEQQGIDQHLYRGTFARTPPNAIMSVANRQADAAGAGDIVLHMNQVKSHINIDQLDYLAKSDPMPHLPWAVSERVDATLAEDIQRLLTGLGNDTFSAHILKKAELTGILPATDSQYDQARRIIKDVYGDDYGVSALK